MVVLPQTSSSRLKRLEEDIIYLKHCRTQPRMHKPHLRKQKSRSRRHRYENIYYLRLIRRTTTNERCLFYIKIQEDNKPFLSLH